MRDLIKRLTPIGIFVACLILIWTLIYYFYGLSTGTGWSMFDCFYYTIIHLAPRPVNEFLPNLTMSSRFITLILIFIGLGAMVYLVGQLTSFIIEGRFSEMYRRRAMLKQIAKLKNHFIICGANRIAQQAISEMLQKEINFVVLEKDHSLITDACSLGNFFYLEDDPTADENLIAAGIKVARGIIIATPVDETNLYILFAARELNPNIRIISRVTEPTAARRMLRAGAHAVVNPDHIGGLRMVSEAVRPTVVSFLDIMMRDTQSAFRIDESTVQKGSPIENKTLDEADIKQKSGALVLAIRKPFLTGFNYNPPNDIKLEAGTAIVVLADTEQIKDFRELTGEAESFVKPER